MVKEGEKIAAMTSYVLCEHVDPVLIYACENMATHAVRSTMMGNRQFGGCDYGAAGQVQYVESNFITKLLESKRRNYPPVTSGIKTRVDRNLRKNVKKRNFDELCLHFLGLAHELSCSGCAMYISILWATQWYPDPPRDPHTEQSTESRFTSEQTERIVRTIESKYPDSSHTSRVVVLQHASTRICVVGRLPAARGIYRVSLAMGRLGAAPYPTNQTVIQRKLVAQLEKLESSAWKVNNEIRISPTSTSNLGWTTEYVSDEISDEDDAKTIIELIQSAWYQPDDARSIDLSPGTSHIRVTLESNWKIIWSFDYMLNVKSLSELIQTRLKKGGTLNKTQPTHSSSIYVVQ